MLCAYFDPGPGSLLVQALAAGSAGGYVLLCWLWQKYRHSPRSFPKPETGTVASSWEVAPDAPSRHAGELASGLNQAASSGGDPARATGTSARR
ncbi:MAG: hypothetical protein JSS02_31650 [Planctomycetes bacterium]|nr:hypothetical protein [Planctomycetota bacterium]